MKTFNAKVESTEAAMPDKTPPKPRRSRWRYFVAGTTCLLLMLGLTRLMYPAWRSQQIIRELNARGFEVVYDFAFYDYIPEWAYCDWFPEFIQSVQIVGKEKSGDNDLRLISELFSLTYSDLQNSAECKLTLTNSDVTDDGLACLRRLPQITMLVVRSHWITDGGVAHLAGLTRLRILTLHDSQITDAGVAYLGQLNSLMALHLHSPHVTDAALEHVCMATIRFPVGDN